MTVRKTIATVLFGAVLLFTGVANASLLGDIGRAVIQGGGSSSGITEAALKRVQREAGYAVLRGVLRGEGCRGADDYVNAIKALVEHEDWGTATAAFYSGLERDGSDEARFVLKTLYAAAVTVRLTNAEVANEILAFVEYVNARYDF